MVFLSLIFNLVSYTCPLDNYNNKFRIQIHASETSGCINEIICSNRHLRNETKARIYKRVFRPILTYAAETRTDKAKTTQILEVNEMKTYLLTYLLTYCMEQSPS